jgi:hypothetical protein
MTRKERARGGDSPGSQIAPSPGSTDAIVADAADLGAAALAYADRGWPVFPLQTGGKLPRISRAHPDDKARQRACRRACGRDGHGCYDATTDPGRVSAWWSRWPRANIGLATGPGSGLLVVDVDGRGGGYAALARLEAAHGALATLEVATPGGTHLYLGYPPGRQVGLSARKLGPGLDTRGAGGYVVAPPSRRPDGAYRWLADPDPILPAPAWLVDRLDPPPVPRTATVFELPAHPGGYWERAVEAELRQLVAEGGHGPLTRSAYRLGQLAHLGIPEAEVIEALADAALVNAGPPRDRAKALDTAGECFAAGKANPRTPRDRP